MKFIETLPPELARRWRKWSSEGGKRGSRAAKVRAGKASGLARRKKAEAAKAKP